MPVASLGAANTPAPPVSKCDSASLICFPAVELEIGRQTTAESTQPSEKPFGARTFLDHQRSLASRVQYDVITFMEV